MELIIYLGLIVCLCSVLLPLLHYGRSWTIDHLTVLHLEREWQMCIQQFEREISQAAWYEINNGNLFAEIEGRLVSFERYQSLLRKRVAGEGHVVVCQFVQTLSFQPVTDRLFYLHMIMEKEGRVRQAERLIALRKGAGDDGKEEDDG